MIKIVTNSIENDGILLKIDAKSVQKKLNRVTKQSSSAFASALYSEQLKIVYRLVVPLAQSMRRTLFGFSIETAPIQLWDAAYTRSRRYDLTVCLSLSHFSSVFMYNTMC